MTVIVPEEISKEPRRQAERKIMMEWTATRKGQPNSDGQYLVTTNYGVDILNWSNDMSKADEFDLEARPGWFGFDGDYGYWECEAVYAWMPLPPPFKD